MGKEEFHWLRGAMHSWFSAKLGSKNITSGGQKCIQDKNAFRPSENVENLKMPLA
jgi:hypothetical protein